MKKNLFQLFPFLTFLFAIVLAGLVAHVYFHSGFPYTHDGENHLARFASYILAIHEHQFPPRFASSLFNHYGYPVFDFNYPLANMLSLPFSFAHIHYEITFKIIVFLSILFGILGSKIWMAKLGFDKKTQLFVMAIFAIDPYLLSAITFRGNIGEILAYCLLPWLFLIIEIIAHHELSWRSPKYVFFLFLFACFWLSHNITAVFAIPLIFIYATTRFKKEWRTWLNFGGIFLGSVALSLWFWLPAIFEKKYIVIDSVALSKEFLLHFPTFNQLLFGPLRFGFSFPGPIDSLSFSVGFVQLFLLILFFVVMGKVFWQKKWMKKHILFLVCGTLAITLFVLQLEVTKPLWIFFTDFARYIQFPWRLTIFWEVVLLPIAGFVFASVKKPWKIFLCALLLWQTLAFSRTKAADYFHRDLRDYDFFSQTTTTLNEDRAKTFTYDNIGVWQPAPQILSGSAQVTVQNWGGSKHIYELQVTQPSIIVEPLMNFPGWETRIKELGKPAKNISFIDSPE